MTRSCAGSRRGSGSKHWSLLITFLREDDTRRHACGGRAGAVPADGAVGQGGRPADRRGHPAPAVLARLAKRLPVVVIAGRHGPAGRGRGVRGQLVRARTRWSSTSSPTTAGAGSSTSTARRPRPTPGSGGRPCTRSSTRHPGTTLVPAPTAGGSAWRAARRPPSGCSPTPARSGRPLPDAIICANDQMAIGVLRTLTARGIRVPEDIAVVGFDDIFPASLTDPPLTTVHQPMRKIGERGLRPADRADRRPDAAPEGRAPPDRAGAAVKLRLPGRAR